jgi:translation initiation factor IF-2
MNQKTYRSPVVAILGHVDHGKTTLLDYLRQSRLTAKEHGGITQKIGAYEISAEFKGYKNNKITFIDTPGHEAFTKLRSRGANVADIALLLIDAKDSLMPQTIESIFHIKSANIPFMVVINKIDLPQANPEKVKNDLLKHEVIVEDKGGKIPVVNISAKTGKGVNELLESILLIAEDLNLEYKVTNPPQAIIIETKKDKRGIVVSAIIKDGCLRVQDTVYIGNQKIKIRSLINDLGQTVKAVFPSTPCEILGCSELPEVGSILSSFAPNNPPPVTTESSSPASLPQFDLNRLLQSQNEEKKLNLILKCDTQGSLEAIDSVLKKITNLNLILKAIGGIYRSDIFLAKNTQAIVVGFNVNVDNKVKELAKQEKVIVKTYPIIYELLEELQEVTLLLQEKEKQEKNLKGEAKILAVFTIEGEKVFGVKIIKGKINLTDNLEVYRDNVLIGKTKLVSLKIRAKTVNEVKKDQEAGMIFSPPLDIRIGDVVKSIL